MNFVRSPHQAAKKSICALLIEHHRSLKNNSLFENSISTFVHGDDYQGFYVVPNSVGTDDISEAICLGIIKLYQIQPINKLIIGIEALYYSGDNQEAFVFALSCLADLATEMKIFGVHLSEKSVPDSAIFDYLLNLDQINGHPIRFEEYLIEGAISGVYSAFTEMPKESAFPSMGILLPTYKIEMTFEGEVTHQKELYRGEGRLENSPHWRVDNYRELANYFLKNGFAARGKGRFQGTLQEQILHQGYVDQPTVSLTGSEKVAAYYGSGGWKREIAVVFAIDMEKLSEIGNSYDSYESMQKYCDWMLASSFEITLKIVKNLDLKSAGKFLDKLDREAMRRVHSFGGGSLFGEPIDWTDFLGNENYEILTGVGLKTDDLEQLQDEFEMLWNITLSGGMFADNIYLTGEGEIGETTEAILKPTYHKAFEMVRPYLEEALSKNKEYGDPGWDLSPFGYIAKTIRDKEFFSPAPIPGHCVKKATLIDSNERILETIER